MPLDAAGDRPRLHGQDHAGEPALRPRPRPLQGGARRRRADHGRLHPGSAAVSGSRGEFSASPAHLRQHPRDRRLVEGRGRGRSESRGADCRGGRRHAADFAGDAREQRRRADLWPRRDRHRGGAASRRSSRHYRASDQARRRDRRAGPTSFPFSRARSAMPADISGSSNLRSTTTRCPPPPRAQSSCSGLRATARPRPAI